MTRGQFWCIFFIGFIFTIVGIFILIYPFYHKIKCTEPTIAKVIGFEKRWSRGNKGRMGRYVYYPVFSYKANGEEIEVEHNVSPTDFQVGEYVELKYNSKNPYQYYIEDSKKAGNWVFIVAGMLFAPMGILGLWFLFTYGQRNPKENYSSPKIAKEEIIIKEIDENYRR